MSYLTEGRYYLIRRVLWGDGLSWGEQAVRQLAFATLRICAPRVCVFCCPSHPPGSYSVHAVFSVCLAFDACRR